MSSVDLPLVLVLLLFRAVRGPSAAWRWLSASRAPMPSGSGSSHPVALPDLDGPVVCGGEHLRRVAGDHDVDHDRALRTEGLLDRRADRAGILDADAGAPEGLRDLGVVRLGKVRGVIRPGAVHEVLERLDVARCRVVDDHDGERETHPARRLELAEHHVEAAVARDADDLALGRCERRAHGARQTVADRGKAAVRHEAAPGLLGVVQEPAPMGRESAVGDEDAVRRHEAIELAYEPAHGHRNLLRDVALPRALAPFGHAAGHALGPGLAAGEAGLSVGTQGLVEILDPGAGVAPEGHVRLERTAELL